MSANRVSSGRRGVAPNHSATRSFASRMGALLLAIVLIMGTAPGAAMAKGGESDRGSNTSAATTSNAKTGKLQTSETAEANEATLTIVFGLNADKTPVLAVNKTYLFEEGDTFESLLEKAVAAKDIEAYELNSTGFVSSVTKTGGEKLATAADWATYWSTFVDNAYYGGSDSIKTMKLESGKAYQLVWDSYPTAVAPEWSALGEPTAGSGIVGATTTNNASSGDEGTDNTTAAGNATLSIVHGLDFYGMPNALAHISYDFAADTTLKDLLDRAVAQSNIGAYTLNDYGYLESFTAAGTTVKNAADFSTYWSMYVDGAYYAGSDTVAGLKLEDGKAYQFAWESYPLATAPDWSLVGTPTEEKPAEEEPPPAQEPAAYSQETFDALFTNIATSYAGTSEDWKALELAAIDKADSADQDKIILGAVAAYEEPDTTNLQRSILSLTALGIDATNVESEDTRYNLIEALGKAQIAHNTANGKMFALLAYASGPYTPEADALRTTEQLVSDVLALQNADGGWSFTGSTSDADMIGIAIAALAPYRSDNAAVEEAIQTGLSTLRAMQLPTGGFASLYTPGEIDVSSTAMAIIALSAADIDAQTWIYTAPTEAQSNVKALSSRAAASDDSLLLAAADTPAATPLNDLLSLANESQDGFLYDGKTNDMATEQGFRALVAYQGFKNTKAAFNVYTQAASGLAAQEPAATEPEPKPEEEPKPTEKPNTPDNTDDADNDATDDSGALPATGDDSYVILLMLAFIVLCALACTVRYARLRRKKSVEEMTRAE